MLHYRQSNYKTLIGFFKTLIQPHQFSTVSAALNLTPSLLPNPLIVDHLVKEFGFPKDKAISASKHFHPSYSPTTLSSVPNFFKQFGFSDTHIRKIISKDHRILVARIDKTLEPKLKFFEEIGFSNSSLADLIASSPTILFCSKDNQLIPTINILRSFLHSNEKIVSVLKKNCWLLLCGRRRIRPNADFLCQCGLSNHRISQILSRSPMIFTFRLDLLKDIVDRVEKLGVGRDSLYFTYAVMAIASMSKSTLEGKFQLYKTYGLSKSDILSAFRKSPAFLTFSEAKIRKMMSFLVDDLGHETKDIVSMPRLFTCSLENKLKPRNEVLKILLSRGLLEKKPDIMKVVNLSEDNFLKYYVFKFVDKFPDFREVYQIPHTMNAF